MDLSLALHAEYDLFQSSGGSSQAQSRPLDKAHWLFLYAEMGPQV